MKLPDVTLYMFESKSPKDGAAVFNYCMKQIEYGHYLFVSDQPRPANLNNSVRFIQSSLTNLQGSALFVINELHKHINTTHALIVHIDGFPINSSLWKPEFMQYD